MLESLWVPASLNFLNKVSSSENDCSFEIKASSRSDDVGKEFGLMIGIIGNIILFIETPTHNLRVRLKKQV